MSDLQSQINQRIESFVIEITELAKRQALETLSGALGGRALGGLRGRASAAPRARSRSKGEKRPAGEIAAMVEQLGGAVADGPGRRIEELGRALAIGTRDLVLPMKKLIAEGRVRTEGERRATRYFPGDGTPGQRRRRSKKK